jgi:hypothetical protein
VSALTTFAEVSPHDPCFDGPWADWSPTSAVASGLRADGRDGYAFHCGTPMELATPAIGPAAGYSFPADDAVLIELPPVWRCQCGFQLDAWRPVQA